MLLSAKEVIKNVLLKYNLEIIDIFECGTSKVEFMVRHNNEIISISMVDDGSYDFTIFNSNGDKIIYSNTERISSINQINECICQDVYKTLLY